MRDIEKIIERHAKWHKSLLRLSWAEKIRMVESAMPAIRALRRQRAEAPKAPAQSSKQS